MNQLSLSAIVAILLLVSVSCSNNSEDQNYAVTGKWTATDKEGNVLIVTYKSDGTFIAEGPNTVSGNYETNGKAISGTSSHYTFTGTIAVNEMTITDSENHTITLTRL